MKILSNGKSVTEESLKELFIKKAIQKIKPSLESVIAQFKNEIESHNGEVFISIEGNKISVKTENIPEDLQNKIAQALQSRPR